MRSGFDIQSALFRILNIPEITGNISGKVMIGNPSPKSQDEDVWINIISNPNRYLQNGYCNVNISVPENNHLSRLRQLTKIIIPLIVDARITTDDGDFFFQIEDDKGIVQGVIDGMVTYNFYINFQTL